MHIVEIPSFFPPYGGEFCLEQSKALKALGHEVRILSNVQLSIKRSLKDFVTYPYGRWTETMEGVECYRSYQRGIPKVIRPNVKRWVSIVESMFADYVKKYGKPDILHAHCAKWAGHAAMKLSRQYGIPYVVTEHLSVKIFEDEFGKAPTDAWQVPLLRQAYEKADKVVVVSEQWADSVECYFGKAYSWECISNIIDTDFFRYHQREPKEGRPFRFCCLANHIPLKGYDVLLPAFDSMSHRNTELHIAGFGTDQADMRRQVAQLSASSRVVLHGRMEKSAIRELLDQCDALVLASRSEVQPLCVLEAMSTGIPVVATEIVPECERIDGGCLIVPVDDVAALSDAMDRMMDMDFLDGEELSRKVSLIASPANVASQLEALFLKLQDGLPNQ